MQRWARWTARPIASLKPSAIALKHEHMWQSSPFVRTLQRLGVFSSTNMMLAYAQNPGAKLILFLWAVLAFLHAYVFTTGIQNDMWQFRMDEERGISEFWEFVMLLTSFALLTFRSLQKGKYAYLVPALILLYMAVDGRMGIHEAVGSAMWPEHRNGGEFIFMGAMGAAFLLALVQVIKQSSAAQKSELICYAVLVVLFGLFGAVIDVSHALLIKFSRDLNSALIWLEDGGELLIISLMLILSLGVFRRLGTS